jgi:hypothetical protein
LIRSLGSWRTNQQAVINPNRHQNSEKYYSKNQTDLDLLHNIHVFILFFLFVTWNAQQSFVRGCAAVHGHFR